MENTEKLNSIVEKLRKLQASYEGAKNINSEEEANAAAAAIHRILMKYNLTMADVNENYVEETDVIKDMVTCNSHMSISGVWEETLTNVLANYNFCKAYRNGGLKYKMYIIGSK